MKNLMLFPVLILLLFSCSSQPRYKDPKLPVEERVEDLLGRMTLQEKINQLQGYYVADTMAFIDTANFAAHADTARLKQGVGSVWALAMRGSLEKRAEAINIIQKYLLEKSRLGIPSFFFSESLHGFMAEGATSFPQAIALGCTWDTALVEKVFQAAALEERSSGTNQVLSPVLDLARDPRWGRTEECYGEDPYLVSRIALAAVHGLQGRDLSDPSEHVAVTLKHFAGHGQSEGGRNTAPVNTGEREFRSTHLYPFEIAVKKGHAQSVMASYNEWDGIPNHVSHELLTDILRHEWGFDGYVMSDGGGIDMLYEVHHATASLPEAGILCLKAGLNYNLGRSAPFDSLAREVKEGLISEKDIDKAAADILRVKFRMGLFENPYADIKKMKSVINSSAHKKLALEAAHEALVLLKNENNLLPLDSNKIRTLAVIGPNAPDIHLGGYSFPRMQDISVLEGIRQFAGSRIKVLYAEGCKLTLNKECNWQVNERPVLSNPENDRKRIAEAVQTARKSDAVLLVLGENELLDREAWSEIHAGDADNLNLVGQQNELAEALLKTGKPVVVLLINGRPLSVNYLAEHVPAIMEGWYLGQETGIAVADILFGKVNPSGKLTVTIPRSVGQLPCFYDKKPSSLRSYVLANSTPLFPFGYGLSYTSFKYDHLKLDPEAIDPSGTTVVTADVSNTGSRAGDEIVELYIHDLVSLPVRPIMELKDFARIHLEPGETKTVKFDLTPDKLESFNMHMKREVSPGDFAVMVGRSSADFLSDTLTVRNSSEE